MPLSGRHDVDSTGNLLGGVASGPHMSIRFAADPDERTGVGPTALTEALLELLRWLQTRTKYACPEYEAAIADVERAQVQIQRRAQDRRLRGVEGTNER